MFEELSHFVRPIFGSKSRKFLPVSVKLIDIEYWNIDEHKSISAFITWQLIVWVQYLKNVNCRKHLTHLWDHSSLTPKVTQYVKIIYLTSTSTIALGAVETKLFVVLYSYRVLQCFQKIIIFELYSEGYASKCYYKTLPKIRFAFESATIASC